MARTYRKAETGELEARLADVEASLRRLETMLTTDDAEENARTWALGISGNLQDRANLPALASGGRDRHPDAVAEVVLAYIAESADFKEWLQRRCAQTAEYAGALPRAERDGEVAKLVREADEIRGELHRRDVEARKAALEAELASLTT